MLFIVKKHISQSSSMPPETAISEFWFFMRNDSWNYFSWRGFMLVEVHLNPQRIYNAENNTCKAAQWKRSAKSSKQGFSVQILQLDDLNGICTQKQN